MDPKQIIAGLIGRRQQLADEMLQHPDDGSAFEYGRAVGMNCGLRLAEALVLELLKDEKEQDE